VARFSELIVIRQRYTPYGGAERFIARMLERLAADGLRIRVLCRDWEGEVPFEITRLPVTALTRTGRARAFARLACTHVNAAPNALVQSHERLPCCDIFRAGDGVHREWLEQRARARGGLTRLLDRLSPFHRYTLSAERRMFTSRRLRYVICNSQMVRDEIIRHYGLPPDRLRVIHNGIDPERFHPGLRGRFRDDMIRRHALDPDRPVFLFVGSGYERKGLAGLLQALASSGPEAQLVVVGRERRLARYTKIAERLGLADRVLFAGPQEQIEPWYGLADACVLPTLYDPFPNVVVEAMACGLPVLTSLKSGASDIIENGRNGLLCDALDTAALARHLATLADAGQRRRLGEAALQSMRPLTLDHMNAAYQALYAEILGDRAQEQRD
jgi:UDP-glucose:(heptosyl)LPS alpha-1,3-glucosyltransferase